MLICVIIWLSEQVVSMPNNCSVSILLIVPHYNPKIPKDTLTQSHKISNIQNSFPDEFIVEVRGARQRTRHDYQLLHPHFETPPLQSASEDCANMTCACVSRFPSSEYLQHVSPNGGGSDCYRLSAFVCRHSGHN